MVTALMRTMWCFSLACVHVHKYTQIVENVSRRLGIPGNPFVVLAWTLDVKDQKIHLTQY